jgi:diguanylate cyclase (GGDEF)-like protein/PAS domain S-box-containing protein
MTPEPLPTATIIRVLLIDDDEDEFLITRDLLRECESRFGRGFSLDWRSNYKEGLLEIERGQHDVYLIDYRLGARSGLELLENAVLNGCDKPLILMTGQGDPAVDTAAMRAGAVDYIVKGEVDAAYLERAIRYSIVQKQNENQLRLAGEQNAQLMAAIESSSVGIVLTTNQNTKSIITYVNSAFSEITGYSSEESIGRDITMLHGVETSPTAIAKIEESIENGLPCAVTLLNYRKDKTPFWNELRISLTKDKNGEIIGHVGFLQDVTEKIGAERALRESRRSLEDAQRLTHLGSWQMELVEYESLDEFTLYWSAETYRILGIDPNSCNPTRSSWFDIIHPEDRSTIIREFDKFIREVTSFNQEYRILRPDGEERYLHVRAEIEFDIGGRPMRVVGTAQDITERKRAEVSWRMVERRLRTVMETVPVVLWSLGMDGLINFCEGKMLSRLGIRSTEAIGKPLQEVYSGNEEVRLLAQKALQGHEGNHIIFVGALVLDVHYAPMRDSEGRQIGVVGVSYDITEQRLAKKQLNETQARWARTIPNIPGMVFRMQLGPDEKLTFTSVSEGCRELFDLSPTEILADSNVLLRMMAMEQLGQFYESLNISARNLNPWNEEILMVRQDNDQRWIRGQARPFKEENGVVVWDGIFIDLTEERRTREELGINRRALNEAQMLAHLGSFNVDLTTKKMHWSDEMFRIFGFEPGDFIPDYKQTIGFIHPADRESTSVAIAAAIESARAIQLSTRILRRDGLLRTLELRARVECNAEGIPIQLVGSAQDITERVESEAALRESEERYALAAKGANDGLWDWNLQSGEIYFSPRWKEMAGFEEDEIGNRPQEWFRCVHPDDLAHLQIQISAHLTKEGGDPLQSDFKDFGKRGQIKQFEVEYRLRHRDGEYRWMLARGLAIYDEGGTVYRIAGSQTDITDRKRSQEDLARNAFYDGLTNLPNRALFLDRLESTIKRAKRNPDHAFAVLFLDLDRFKKINDSLGHHSGDKLLIEAAKRFELCLRPDDTVARLGGDEFAVLLDGLASSEHIDLVAMRIQKELEKPFDLEGREVFITVSIGVASASGASRPEDLLRNADTAMYRAKGQGRARYEIFDASMHQRAVRLLEMESDLWRAIDRDELRLHYQPIIGLESGCIEGFEALVRWQHPRRGLVSPGEFIPLAEETGLIVPIGWWVLKEAVRQAREWNIDFAQRLFVSVNLSSKQFAEEQMVKRVGKVLADANIDPTLVKLEITESVIMENTESASTMLRELKELGIELSMDDFGTGYSSLSYLHRFPIDILKIDRSFVSQMKSNEGSGEIVGTIISMAKGLSMGVVAEGVETAQQLQGLYDLGCTYAQGFYISRPVEQSQIKDLMQRQPFGK